MSNSSITKSNIINKVAMKSGDNPGYQLDLIQNYPQEGLTQLFYPSKDGGSLATTLFTISNGTLTSTRVNLQVAAGLVKGNATLLVATVAAGAIDLNSEL